MTDERAERERAFFERMAVEHGQHWWGNSTPAGRRRQLIRAEMAIRMVGMNNSKNILEVGCGSGEFSCHFGHCGANVTSVDISPGLISLAKTRCSYPNINFKVENVEQINCEDETYDAVIGNAILHHLNLEKVLPEFKRVLKPGGVLFFTEPNMMNPLVWLMFHFPGIKPRLQVSEDETAFYRWELKKILQSSGFKDVVIQPFDFLIPVVPPGLIDFMVTVGSKLENTVIIREFAASLSLFAKY